MKYQHMTHVVVQESNLETRIYAWKSILPFCFYLTKLCMVWDVLCSTAQPSGNTAPRVKAVA